MPNAERQWPGLVRSAIPGGSNCPLPPQKKTRRDSRFPRRMIQIPPIFESTLTPNFFAVFRGRFRGRTLPSPAQFYLGNFRRRSLVCPLAFLTDERPQPRQRRAPGPSDPLCSWSTGGCSGAPARGRPPRCPPATAPHPPLPGAHTQPRVGTGHRLAAREPLPPHRLTHFPFEYGDGLFSSSPAFELVRSKGSSIGGWLASICVALGGGSPHTPEDLRMDRFFSFQMSIIKKSLKTTR